MCVHTCARPYDSQMFLSSVLVLPSCRSELSLYAARIHQLIHSPLVSFLFFSLFHLLSRCHPRVLVYERVCKENIQSNKSHPAKKKRSLFFQMKFNSSTSLWILVFVLICLGNVLSAGFVRSFTQSSSTTRRIFSVVLDEISTKY